MNLKSKYVIAGVVAFLSLVFLLGYQAGKNKLPTKVDTKIEDELRAKVDELNQRLTESQLAYSKLKSEQKNKTKITVVNVDGSSTTQEVSSSVTQESEIGILRTKITEQQRIISDLERDLKAHQVVKNACNGIFAGPGITSQLEPKGSAGAFFGHHMVLLTSDGDKDHAGFYNFIIPF